MRISHKMGIMLTSIFLISLVLFAVTLWVINSQRNDGLAINLAGRQRMLSQKMTKELLLYQMNKKTSPENFKKHKELTENTMKIFDMTLDALKDAGKAPLSLNLEKTDYRICPKADEPAFSQLAIVKSIWKEFSDHMKSVLDEKDADGTHMNWVINNSLSLLGEMNKAVIMMQKQSEEKVHMLSIIQTAGIIILSIFILGSILVSVFIARSVRNLGEVLKDIAQGEGEPSRNFGCKLFLGNPVTYSF